MSLQQQIDSSTQLVVKVYLEDGLYHDLHVHIHIYVHMLILVEENVQNLHGEYAVYLLHYHVECQGRSD
ncbi:hypothetical protein BJV82DRAFT_665799 [Fennellomyces sp. T-0311]|nr:hypothetical protein BJV82DRAFT_665799 [Fennellomyces sp. T-0311]